MTAQNLADTRLVDGIPAHRLFEGLSSLYRWIIVTDGDRRILWMSNALRELVGAMTTESLEQVASRPEVEKAFQRASRNRDRALQQFPPTVESVKELGSWPIELSLKLGHEGSVGLPTIADVLKE